MNGKRGFLSANLLKIIAAALMLVDHIGMIFFPSLPAFRAVGRLAFPLFAFMIAEGCRYTKNKLRYFLTVFLLAAIVQLVYFFYDGSTYMCVLVTFSASILLIFALQFAQKTLAAAGVGVGKKIAACLPFLLGVGAAYALNAFVQIDYGFWGCMLPVFAALFPQSREKENLGAYLCKMGCFALGILVLAIDRTLAHGMPLQFYALFAVLILLLYSGERGKWKLKYFFYLFYPLHLVALQGLYWLINM
ncbi:MAG: hypothetical protein IJX98_02795 [Clostridia bacterium]|nr:hypothetical protein [Clostridia bacterium]